MDRVVVGKLCGSSETARGNDARFRAFKRKDDGMEGRSGQECTPMVVIADEHYPLQRLTWTGGTTKMVNFGNRNYLIILIIRR